MVTKTALQKAKDIVINRIHRDGPYLEGRDRPILFNLQWYGDREFIMRDKKKLRDGIYVNEDFPREIDERRKVLRPILKLAISSGNYKGKVSLRYDKLILNSKVYTMNNLRDLPSDVDPAKIGSREGNNVTAFIGIHNPFSNFYPARFKIDNTTYNSAEQFIQASKAQLFDDDETHHKIMQTVNPFEIKRLGGTVKNFIPQKWDQKSYDIAFKGVLHKFCANESLMERLTNTGNSTLVEATRDRMWGCGLPLTHYGILQREQWLNEGGLMSKVYDAVKHELGIIK